MDQPFPKFCMGFSFLKENSQRGLQILIRGAHFMSKTENNDYFGQKEATSQKVA